MPSRRATAGPRLAAGKQVDELANHHILQRADRVRLGKQIVGMRRQDLQEVTIGGHYREVHHTVR